MNLRVLVIQSMFCSTLKISLNSLDFNPIFKSGVSYSEHYVFPTAHAMSGRVTVMQGISSSTHSM